MPPVPEVCQIHSKIRLPEVLVKFYPKEDRYAGNDIDTAREISVEMNRVCKYGKYRKTGISLRIVKYRIYIVSGGVREDHFLK